MLRLINRLWIIPLISVLFGAATLQAQSYTPRIEWNDCPLDVPTGESEGDTLSCGSLFVPQDRQNLSEREIELAFVVIYSSSSNPAEPIVYLEGGPGGSAISGLSDWVNFTLRGQHDIILLDQRGTGYSEPRLYCHEEETLDDYTSDADYEAALNTCQQRLAKEGVDLSDYNSAENAADVSDLRIALAVNQWNLFGISYGTRLALTVMRDHPEGIRSVILDSTYPPVVDGYEEQSFNTYRSFQQLFDDCNADAACSAAFPDLENRFFSLIDRLNDNPAQLGDEYWVELYGDDLLGFISQSFYDTAAIPYLPLLIDEIERGVYDTFFGLDEDTIFDYQRQADNDDLVTQFVDKFFTLTESMDDDTFYALHDAVWEAVYWEDVTGILYDYFAEDDAATLAGLLDAMSDDDLERLDIELFGSDDPVYQFVNEFYTYTDAMDDDTFFALYDAMWEAAYWEDVNDLLYDYLAEEDAATLVGLLNELSDDDLVRLETELFSEDGYGSDYADTEDVSDTDGMFNAVECNEELPFNSFEDAEAIAANLPVQIRIYELESLAQQFSVCNVWNSGVADAIEDTAVVSDIPTLVLAGSYDPVTPPSWGQIAADTLSNSFFFEFPGVGHGAVDGGDCPMGIITAFINNPTAEPDSGCIASMKATFVMP